MSSIETESAPRSAISFDSMRCATIGWSAPSIRHIIWSKRSWPKNGSYKHGGAGIWNTPTVSAAQSMS